MAFCTKHETYPLFETCPLCELKTIRETVGKVYANTEHEEDRADQTFIEMGVIAGDGLLGVVVEAVQDLAQAAENWSYRGGDGTYARKVEEAWVKVFAALKPIEEVCG